MDNIIPEYKIVRSGRKTLALTVDKNGMLVARAPYGMPESRIEAFISEKADWVEKNVRINTERAEERVSVLSEPPAELPLLGELAKVEHGQPYGYFSGVFMLPEGVPLAGLLPYLRRLYGRLARETLIPRAKLTAERMGIEISAVKVNSASSRWGSCSSSGVINLSWKLIAASPELIDYVIVHELCHTAYMDHSEKFWDMVSGYIPDYKEKREALKDVQRLLTKYGLE